MPDGEVELLIHYQETVPGDLEQARRLHLETLFSGIRRHSPNRSREDIDRQIAEERAAWSQ